MVQGSVHTVHLSLFCFTVSEGWGVGGTLKSWGISKWSWQTCSTFSQSTKRRDTVAPPSSWVFFFSGCFVCWHWGQDLPLNVLFSHEQLDFKLQHLSRSHFPQEPQECRQQPLGWEGDDGRELLDDIVSCLCPFPSDRADRYGFCFVVALILICATASLNTPVILYLVSCLSCSTGWCHRQLSVLYFPYVSPT